MKKVIFSADERSLLTQDLHDDLYELIHQNCEAASLTLPEVVGVLEILKTNFIAEQFSIYDENDE